MSKLKAMCAVGTGDCVESRALTHALSHVKSQDPQNVQALLSLERKLETDRSRYLRSWADSVSKLQSQLQVLKLEVRDDFAMELRDAQHYRVNMFDMEAKISEIKDLIKNELRSLAKEEAELHKELRLTGRRVQDWGRPLQASLFKPVTSTVCKVMRQEDKSDPLGEFQKFLTETGGHYGGWEEQDHLAFLRERRKCNGRGRFIAAVQAILPDVNVEEIEAHEEWYKKYELLKNQRRERIRKWRESKTLSCEQRVIPERSAEIANEAKPRNITYQRDIAERIKEWKRQQQVKKAEQEERERKERESLAEERIKKRELQKAKRLAVEQYKAEKIIKMQNELMASQKIKELKAIEERARKNLLLRAFREQDEQYIERIKSLRARSASRGRRKLERPETAKPAIEITERDRRRHLQPTQVWSQHCAKQDVQSVRPGNIMDLQTIPHLYVPALYKH